MAHQYPGTPMEGVTEYDERLPVRLDEFEGRPTIVAYIEAGHCAATVDLLQLLAWLRANRSDLLKE